MIPFLSILTLTCSQPSYFIPFVFPPYLFSLLLEPTESTFAEFETFVLDNLCLDQTLDDGDIERLEHHFEVKDLTLGHPMSFDFHISFDWLCRGLVPSPFRDVLHLGHSYHSRWNIH